MPALMPYVHTDFNVIGTWEAGNSLIKCHSFPFIEMQGDTNSLTLFVFCCSTVEAFFGVLWMASELPATFLLYLCCVPETVLHCVFQLIRIFRLLSSFLWLCVKLQVLGLVKEEGERVKELPTYLVEVFSPVAQDFSDWFAHFGGHWHPSQYQGCCYDPAPQVQDEWNLMKEYISFISEFDSLFSSASDIFLQSHLLYSLLDFWIFAQGLYSS